MRMSDWSSDVSSSDLVCPDERRISGKARRLDVDLADRQVVPAKRAAADGAVGRRPSDKGAEADIRAALLAEPGEILADLKARKIAVERRGDVAVPFDLAILGQDAPPGGGKRAAVRSEEHTSELQSLM